ncbi:MAG: peptidoglycan DD-metalloendopeptidase family protein, partial [Lacrimispora sphenoides]
VVKQVKQHYKNDETTKIEIEEQTRAKEMKLENGDEKPEILSVEQAAARITAEKNLTVKTTEQITQAEPVAFQEVTQKTDKLYEGQTKIKTKGEKGLKEVKKQITKENGSPVKTDVIEERILKEPENRVILTGIKENPDPETAVSRGGNVRGTGQLAHPVSSLNVTSNFGPRWGRTHLGVDLGMPTGAPIRAADNGTVISSGYSGSYGNLIKLDHGNGIVTYYAHCSALEANTGQAVKKGQVIAKVGSTGNSTGPHLHFEVRVNDQNVNPLNYL